jgi:hypothetical protein
LAEVAFAIIVILITLGAAALFWIFVISTAIKVSGHGGKKAVLHKRK